MSSARDGRPIVTNAREIDARAASWIQKREFWGWSEADQTQFADWLAESPAHRVAFVRLTIGWGRTERLAALRPSQQEKVAATSSRRSTPILRRAVASMAIAIILGASAFVLLSRPNTQTYATAVGGHRMVSLADGSQIELNTDTVLRVSIGTHEREISLDRGEAYFKIRHDARRVFVVVAGDRRITDLGTAFAVRRDSGRLEVAVVEGRVQLDATDNQRQKSATLTSGDTAVATANSVSVRKEPNQKLTSELGWRRGVLVFEHTTLADAVTEFNRYNREKLLIVDPVAGRRTIGATFHTNDIGAFTRLAKEVFGLRVEDRGDEIVISR